MSNAYSLEALLAYYLGQIHLGLIFSTFGVYFAERWLIYFVVIALLVQIFRGQQYPKNLVVLTDRHIFGLFLA